MTVLYRIAASSPSMAFCVSKPCVEELGTERESLIAKPLRQIAMGSLLFIKHERP